MKKHILEERAYTYDIPKKVPEMKDCYFDNLRGYWILESGNPCMEDANFPKPTSKKCDVETGEDQKGE